MVDNFPKTFSQAATSRWYFPQRQLPVGIFPSGTFPTVQFPKRQLPKYILFSAIGFIAFLATVHNAASAAPNGLTKPLESSRLENCTFGKLPIGKLALGKSPFGKLLTPLFLFTLIFNKIFNKF